MRKFRLGSTSYVYPADLVTNARQLAGVVEDIELVLFETANHETNFPARAQVQELKQIANENGLTYTVHLPTDLKFGDAVSYDKIRRALASVEILEPFAYVTHLDGKNFLSDTAPASIARWQQEAERALLELCAWVGDTSRVCVENVEGWSPDYFAGILAETNIKRCVDVGHFWVQSRDPLPHLTENLYRTRVIHLHGVNGRDHASLKFVADAQLFPIVRALLEQNYDGVVTLEVFGEDDFFSSRAALLRAVEMID